MLSQIVARDQQRPQLQADQLGLLYIGFGKTRAEPTLTLSLVFDNWIPKKEPSEAVAWTVGYITEANFHCVVYTGFLSYVFR